MLQQFGSSKPSVNIWPVRTKRRLCTMMYFDLLNNNTSYSFYPFIVTFNNCGTSAKKKQTKKNPRLLKREKTARRVTEKFLQLYIWLLQSPNAGDSFQRRELCQILQKIKIADRTFNGASVLALRACLLTLSVCLSQASWTTSVPVTSCGTFWWCWCSTGGTRPPSTSHTTGTASRVRGSASSALAAGTYNPRRRETTF